MEAVRFLLILFFAGVFVFVVLQKSGIVKKLKANNVDTSKWMVIDPKDVSQYISGDNDLDLKFEQLDDEEYIQRRFVMGRGSWRATQGNIYLYNIFEKEIADEFSKRI